MAGPIRKTAGPMPNHRPRQFSDEAVLEQAMRTFWQRGFEATSLQALQASTGLSRSSLYNAFGSKRELFERVMDRYGQERNVGLLAALQYGSRGLDDVRAFFEGLAQALSAPRQARGCFMVNSMIEFGGADAVVMRKGTAYFARVQRAFSTALRRAAERGETEAGDIEDRARLLVTLAMGMNVQARAGSCHRELQQLARIAGRQIDVWRVRRASRSTLRGSRPVHR